MDADMRTLWNRMDSATLRGYRLYGGTALALYLNHRKSTDFDFFRTDGGPVERKLIEQWPWLRRARLRGESGMVDAFVRGVHRDVKLNFVSIEDFNGLPSSRPPNRAGNGVFVGHPVDVLTGKLAAMSNRREMRDYWDIAVARRAIPEFLNEAAGLYMADRMTAEGTPVELAKTVLAFPFKVEHELPAPLLEALADFAGSLDRPDHRAAARNDRGGAPSSDPGAYEP